jgi:hypothetical protein
MQQEFSNDPKDKNILLPRQMAYCCKFGSHAIIYCIPHPQGDGQSEER